MNRWKAAAIHLAIGLLVLGTVVAAIAHFWYPHALYRIAGVDQLLLTMLCVDLVAGPLLTLIVFKAGDPRTPRDLLVVALLQAGFLGYALHTAWQTRPVYLVWSIDHFVLVFASEIEPRHLDEATDPALRRLPWAGPKLLAVTLPADTAAKATIFASLVASQSSIERLPKYLGSYAAQAPQVLRRAATVDAARSTLGARLDAAVAETGRDPGTLRALAIESSRENSTLLVDAADAQPLRVLLPAPLPGTGATPAR